LPLYEESGILCRIPDFWKTRTSPYRVSVTVGTGTPAELGYNALLDFNASLLLGGESVTAEEAEKLLAESEGLALIKGKWIEIDHSKLQATLKAYERAHALMADGISLSEAMRMQLSINRSMEGPDGAGRVEISNGEWLKSVFSQLTQPQAIRSVPPGAGFKGDLRPYQQKGLDWLLFMHTLGFGACLADDMGLGKTVQVIALLNRLKTKKESGGCLLIVPASLIANWTAELRRFAPSLAFRVEHPSEKGESGDTVNGERDPADLVITTYGLVRRYEWLSARKWNIVILDEAQAIKNPGTGQTRAVKALAARHKIVMTGTPMENRLSDLWSLFDFLNPGLLGTTREFTAFCKRLAASPDGYARLKKVVSPFILRRLKTDKSVISDLPEKIEMKTYADLTKKQAVLYADLVGELGARIADAGSGIARKGLILASLMKLKQICNHPDQYLGRDVYNEEESGKYARLREICETIREKRERVLVFTQFREITEPLKEFLSGIFGHEGLVLHGQTAVAKRKTIVDRFQGDEYVPFMVLSIKAGGVGLNLTRASHVIHFDRWWNPAVENQATDRAFRIGQKKNVVVHKFITRGTVEEKIDAMIERKQGLALGIIPDAQEAWITEMSDDQLVDLFSLSV
jgi:SNF2 family DNA or RNA helicase